MTDQTDLTPPEKPCSHPNAAQFDFWLGEWDLTWADGGEGTNTITKIMDGCVIQEAFDSPKDGFRGMSVSAYVARLGVWKQTWVDNNGSYLDFIGGFDGERMILARQVEFEGKPLHQRMVWYNIDPDELDWNWQRSNNGESWKTLWHIHYRRR